MPPTPPLPTAERSAASAAPGGQPRRADASAVAPTAGATPIDPSEEITPEELASIPDPTPGLAETTAAPTTTDPTAAPTTTDPTAAPTTANLQTDVAKSPDGSTIPVQSVDDDVHWVWRVQIFASPDLAQAARISKAASARLGEQASIEYEGALYKVRLGSFESEDEAQTLRERAVVEGFPGAFRARTAVHPNDYTE